MLKNYRLVLFIFSLNSLFAGAFAQVKKAGTAIIYGDNKQAGRYLTTRGFKMYYETYGQGEPLIMIHGNGGSIANFKNQIPYFSKDYKVIVADSRAQGKSVDGKDSLSYEMMADDLNALLDSLHLKNCYVAGWSDGGINGLLLAIRHPDKVKKLAVTGANLWPDTTAVEPFIQKLIADDTKSLRDSIAKMPHPPAQLKNSYKLNYMMVTQPHISLEQLHGIACPTLVIGGDHDVILPKHALLIADAIPQSYLWIIPNSGHGTPIYKKEQFNAIVAEFFKSPYRKIEKFGRLR